jgi:hypothetical protein
MHLDMLNQTGMAIIVVGRSDTSSTTYRGHEYLDLEEDQMNVASIVGSLSSHLDRNVILISVDLDLRDIKFVGRRIELAKWGDLSKVANTLL